MLGIAGLADKSEHITNQRFIHSHLGNRLLHFQHIGAREHRFHKLQLCCPSLPAQDFAFAACVAKANVFELDPTFDLGQRMRLRRVDVDIVRIRQIAKRARADLLGRIPRDPTQRIIDAQKSAYSSICCGGLVWWG